MHIFDYSFLRNLSVSSEFASRLVKIEGFRSNSRNFASNNQKIANDMIGLAMVMSTMDSNAIEGICTEDNRIMGLLSGRVKPAGHNEYEIIGYKEALKRIHENPQMELSEQTILGMFETMISFTGAPKGYKTRDNVIAKRNDVGAITRVIKTVPHDEVEDSMFQLIAAFEEARNDMSIDNILLIPCFIVDFLNIHPFADGNGRMSRLLTTLLLYQEGYDVCAYVSLESIINASKKDYYVALESSGEGWSENMSDYLPFMDYFIGTLFLAYREFDRRIAACSGKGDKRERIRMVVLNSSLPISKGEICSLLSDISETYVELVLSELLKDGKIRKIGNVRATRYMHVRCLPS